MTDSENPTEMRTEIESASATPVTSTYKVKGQLEADNDPAILGQNDANGGTPIGVQGAVPNNTGGYGLYTNQNAYVDSTLDVGTVSFADSDGDGNSFSVTEDGTDGNLEISHGGTPTHELGKGGNLNITSELTENTSL